MKIYICDHCEKSFEELSRIRVLFKQWSDDDKPREWREVCMDCFVKLEAWLGIKREPWMTYYNEKIKGREEFEELDEIYKK